MVFQVIDATVEKISAEQEAAAGMELSYLVLVLSFEIRFG